MSRYTTLLFDLDNTLLDFTKAEFICIKELFARHSLPNDDASVVRYSQINDLYWKAFERGEIEAEEIYTGRFDTFAREKGIVADSEKLAKDYLALLSQCPIEAEGCESVLSNARKKGYDISVITNGIACNQRSRINLCCIKDYITDVFISEELLSKKPEKLFFDRVFEKLPEKSKSRILVIGDSLSSDIKGAKNAGLDSCLLTTEKGDLPVEPTYRIEKLTDLMNII